MKCDANIMTYVVLLLLIHISYTWVNAAFITHGKVPSNTLLDVLIVCYCVHT